MIGATYHCIPYTIVPRLEGVGENRRLDAAVLLVDEHAVQIYHDILIGGKNRVIQQRSRHFFNVDVEGIPVGKVKKAHGRPAHVKISGDGTDEAVLFLRCLRFRAGHSLFRFNACIRRRFGRLSGSLLAASCKGRSEHGQAQKKCGQFFRLHAIPFPGGPVPLSVI